MARTIPGQSITQRLMRRAAMRPRIGARPEFFERLGVADPLAFDGDGLDWAVNADGREGMFSFLTASAYYHDLRSSRYRFMQRVSAGQQRKVAGERLRSFGACAAMVRPSVLASFADSDLLDHFVETPEEPALEETPARVFYRDRLIERPRDRSRRNRARPVERAMSRDTADSDDDSPIVRAIGELVRTFSGRARRQVTTLVERIRVLPEGRQVEAARREMRQLRGFAAASAQVLIDEVEAETSQTPLRVAQARMPARGRPQKGLRRVLGQSPAILTLEAPVEEQGIDPVRASRRAVRGPEFGRVPRASARREAPMSAARERARTQQVSGRAGPVGSTPHIDAARARQTRRPTEWMASLAVAAPSASSEVTYGLAAAGSRPIVDRGTGRVAARAHAGDIDPATGISSGATGWMKRATRRSSYGRARVGVAPESRLIEAPEETPLHEVQGLAGAPAARVPPTIAAPTPPRAAPTVHALRRSRTVRPHRLSASPVQPAGEIASVGRVSRRQTPTLRASARAAVSRRSLTASPIQTALLAAELGETAPVDSRTGLRAVAAPARRQMRRGVESLVEPSFAPTRRVSRLPYRATSGAIAPPEQRLAVPSEDSVGTAPETIRQAAMARPTTRVADRGASVAVPTPEFGVGQAPGQVGPGLGQALGHIGPGLGQALGRASPRS